MSIFEKLFISKKTREVIEKGKELEKETDRLIAIAKEDLKKVDKNDNRQAISNLLKMWEEELKES